ncbi:MAG TPA: endonuclease/exonuclease/phosphatase family protein [Fimbriimonadaceae bacterium]|nr:endonuclease/exonuclease/phosphatase family protein [Fimbriimonadaceae bacterium]
MGDDLRVATLNVRHGLADDGANSWSFRQAEALNFLRSLEADVLLIQEALDFQVDALREQFAGWQDFGVGRIDGKRDGEFALILVRPEMKVEDSGNFWFSETPDVPGSMAWETACERICTWVQLDGLKIYNLHLDHESAWARDESVRLLLSRIGEAPTPTIVGGDFNCLPDSSPIQTMLLAGFAEAGLDTDSTFHGWGLVDGGKIDYLFARNLRTTSYQRQEAWFEGLWISDHHAVIAEFQSNNPQ